MLVMIKPTSLRYGVGLLSSEVSQVHEAEGATYRRNSIFCISVVVKPGEAIIGKS